MPAPTPSTRRLAIAIGTAATSVTLAIGVTAASLLGWFSPAAKPEPAPETTAPAPSPDNPIILVPVSPTPAPQPVADPGGEVRLADREHETSKREKHDRRKHRREHHDEDGDDD